MNPIGKEVGGAVWASLYISLLLSNYLGRDLQIHAYFNIYLQNKILQNIPVNQRSTTTTRHNELLPTAINPGQSHQVTIHHNKLIALE
jgi:hypothetical protein